MRGFSQKRDAVGRPGWRWRLKFARHHGKGFAGPTTSNHVAQARRYLEAGINGLGSPRQRVVHGNACDKAGSSLLCSLRT
jgi:hypothetical protein